MWSSSLLSAAHLELVPPPCLGVEDPGPAYLGDLRAAPLARALLHQHLGQQAALPRVWLVAWAGLDAGQAGGERHQKHHDPVDCHLASNLFGQHYHYNDTLGFTFMTHSFSLET